MEVNIDKEDLWVMLLSTIRYSMGRQTYMSSLAPELVIKYSSGLSKESLRQIEEEIDYELKMCERNNMFLGSRLDHEAWRKGLEDIRKLTDDR